MIVRRGKKFCLVTKSKPRRTLGCHTSRAKAVRQERAVQASKARRDK